jgi:hypothetical protein
LPTKASGRGNQSVTSFGRTIRRGVEEFEGGGALRVLRVEDFSRHGILDLAGERRLLKSNRHVDETRVHRVRYIGETMTVALVAA